MKRLAPSAGPGALLLAALAGLVLAAPVGLTTAHAGGPRDDTLPVSALKPGMKGYGLTVFEGTEPSRFEVEVLGVLQNFRPRQPLVLIKTTHPRLQIAKVVAGMSGSPIYIDGKMIGAYAYGWTFPAESVAGVTPIANMLEDLDRKLPPSIDGFPLSLLPVPPSERARQSRAESARGAAFGAREDGPTGEARPMGEASEAWRSDPRRFSGAPGRYDLAAHARQLAAARERELGLGPATLRPVATPLLLGGLSAGARDFLAEMLEPLGLEPVQAGGGGGTESDAPTRFVDGGAIGVELVRGDVTMSGLGTVTRVEGDRLVAFGHPMMGVGVTALPTAVGRIIWFLASEQRSFKLGYDVRPLGALVNDRPASIVVDQSLKAPTIPVHLKLEGPIPAGTGDWRFDVAQDRFLTPSLIAAALSSALEQTVSERRDITWLAKTRLSVRGEAPVDIVDFGVTSGGLAGGQLSRTRLVNALGALLNNPWGDVRLEGAEIALEVRYAHETERLRGIEVLTPVVEAGQPAKLKLSVIPYHGKEHDLFVEVPIPASYAGETVTLRVAPGYTQGPVLADPMNLSELLRNLATPSFEPRSVVVSYEARGRGVAFDGKLARDLPPGAMDMLRPQSSSIAPVAFDPEIHEIVPLKDFLVGTDDVSITVKKVLR